MTKEKQNQGAVQDREKTGHRLAVFPNRRSVYLHLEAVGWLVSPAKLYRDFEKGLIEMEPDGTVLEVEARNYALTNLSKVDATLDDGKDIQKEKAKKEIVKLDEQIARLKFQRQKEEGKYIPRTDFEAEMVARAVVMDSGFRHVFNTQVHEWIAMVGGKPEKSGDLLEALNQALDSQLNQYATTQTFHVIFTDG